MLIKHPPCAGHRGSPEEHHGPGLCPRRAFLGGRGVERRCDRCRRSSPVVMVVTMLMNQDWGRGLGGAATVAVTTDEIEANIGPHINLLRRKGERATTKQLGRKSSSGKQNGKCRKPGALVASGHWGHRQRARGLEGEEGTGEIGARKEFGVCIQCIGKERLVAFQQGV